MAKATQREKSVLRNLPRRLAKAALGAMLVPGFVSAASAATYTVTLPAGVTNTLAEAFANTYVTSSEGTPTPEGLYGASELSVTGGGRLEINVDLKTAGFAGEIRVKPGATLRITAKGALGDTAHGTFVESGATLENECLDTSANNLLDFAGEPLTFAGAGVDGVGALVARTPVKQERNGVWGGTVLTMTGDAMISTVNGYQDFPCNSSNSSLDMNGHTLTVRGISNAQGVQPGNVCLRPVVTNPGHIVISNCNASINNDANLGGSSANVLTVGKGCRFELYSAPAADRRKWTLNIHPEASSACLQTTSLGGRWDGPIVFPACATPWNFGLQGQKATPVITNHSTLAGVITSAARLQFFNSSTALPDSYLTLTSPENSFAKGVAFANLHLTLDVDGALPRNCGTAVVQSASIDFNPSVAAYALPVLCVSNSATIGDARGSWAGVIKRQAGTLAYNSALTFPELTLEGGTVKMGSAGTGKAWYAGLHYGYDDKFDAWYSSDPTKRIANQVFYNENFAIATNKVVYDFSDLKVKKTASGSGTMYTGYIMNNGASDVTWRFASCCKTLAYLKVNDVKTIARQGDGEVAFGNAVLHPGANSFKYVIGSNGGPTIPNPPSNNANWTNGWGFAVSKTSTTSTDPADFVELSDPGDGSVLRIAEPGSAYEHELAVAYTNGFARSVGCVTAAKGTTLDLCDGGWTVARVEGPLAVTSTDTDAYAPMPSFTVSDTLAAAGADLVAGDRLACDAQLAFASGAKIAISGGKAAFRTAPDKRAAVATSRVPITGAAPVVESDDGAMFRSEFSADRKTLSVVFIPSGSVLVIR